MLNRLGFLLPGTRVTSFGVLFFYTLSATNLLEGECLVEDTRYNKLSLCFLRLLRNVCKILCSSLCFLLNFSYEVLINLRYNIHFELLSCLMLGYTDAVCRGSVYRALGLMVAASPCALAVAPLAYATAISSCARKVPVSYIFKLNVIILLNCIEQFLYLPDIVICFSYIETKREKHSSSVDTNRYCSHNPHTWRLYNYVVP